MIKEIIGQNIINFKTKEIQSHNPTDRLRVTRIGLMFKNFKGGGKNSEIETNTIYTDSIIEGRTGKTRVLVHIADNFTSSIRETYNSLSIKASIVPPKAMEIDIEFFCVIDDKEYQLAVYNKENNILFSSPIMVQSMHVSYYDNIADYLSYYKIIKNIKKMANKVLSSSITIGIDGELEPVDKASLYPFSLRDVPENELGCVRLSADLEAQIGIDLGYGQMELRPGYGTPNNVVSSVISLMKKLKKDKYHVSTKGNKYPLGCHVHFGFGFPVAAQNQLLFLLDYFIGIKMMRLSGSSRGHFNKKSQARTKAHGFEYRSMPSAIMENPQILKIVLKICLIVIRKYNDKHTFKLLHDNFAVVDDYLNLGISHSDIKDLNKFCKEYKALTYEQNMLVAWTNERRKDKK